ncbi:MAG TPA: hypothetical protein VN158_14345, partial [Caulobacter sp.]|nr:hypothetical protein [Caulobacter sp.]
MLTVALVLGIAFGGVVLRLAFEPVLGERGLYLFFFPAIVAAAALRGLKGGLAAIGLTTALFVVLTTVRRPLETGDYVGAALYAA